MQELEIIKRRVGALKAQREEIAAQIQAKSEELRRLTTQDIAAAGALAVLESMLSELESEKEDGL